MDNTALIVTVDEDVTRDDIFGIYHHKGVLLSREARENPV